MQPITVASNGIEIAYETFGASGGRPLLLVMGLGGQMLAWHPELCAALAAEDFFVVRYDNRDVGLSTHLHDAPPPNLVAAMGGDFSSASYQFEDMAGDAVGLLDAVGLDRAHVVGAYDRGFDPAGIARQRLAIYASGDRSAALARVTTPALVMHGEADPLIQLAGGQATAAALPDAELLVLPGMGHGLPREIWPTLVTAITRLADRAKALRN